MTTITIGEPTPSDREVLTGLVERVTYQNAENGFCVLRVKARGRRELVTVVGHAAGEAGQSVGIKPMGARALYLYQGDQDTLYRIHGTNQPEYIGRAISSGCIRMTNEDAIDLYNQVKIGAPVVVFPPGQGV